MADRPERRAPKASRKSARKSRTKRRQTTVARHPSARTSSGRRPLSPRVRKRRAVLGTTLVGLAVVVFLFAFVYPTSTFFQQRSEVNEAEERLERLEAETRRLEQQTKKLNTDAEIERLAREQYGLVRPGETPYAIVPASSTTLPAGDGDTQP